MLTEEGKELPTTADQDYSRWLAEWNNNLQNGPTICLVPSSARSIHTPLIHASWERELIHHPNQLLTSFFLTGISQGFRIGFNMPKAGLKSARRNLTGALQHPDVVQEYLKCEVSNNRVVGPFQKPLSPPVHVSRFGVIPKRHQHNKWRLIVDLSYPHNYSINDGIPKSLCSLTYITLEDAIKEIQKTGCNTLLAKVDIKNAFRLLPVHPSDRHLLAMEWNQQIYIDTCLPFGLRSAPKLFNILADLLSWITRQRGVSTSMHYLDDYLIIGPPTSSACQSQLDTFQTVCNELGIPLATEKVEGPSTCLTFLGIIIDTNRMEIRLPEDKLLRIRQELAAWLTKRKATKKEILSLVGVLQHATRVVRPGRTFVARMYQTAAKVKELNYFTRLNLEFRSDLYWWYTFITNWNGRSILRSPATGISPDRHIQTDASGSWGCGAVMEGQWFQWPWPPEWESVGIMAKELAPIMLSCIVWGPKLATKHTLFQCDNAGLVAAIKKGSSKDQTVMHLLRSMWFFTALFDIEMTIEHIPGVSNTAADMLSRNNITHFLLSSPQADKLPTPIHPLLNFIVSPTGPDWTSSIFRQKLRDIILLAYQNPPGTPTQLANTST